MLLKENITGGKACYKTTLKCKESKDSYIFKFKAFHSSFFSISDKYNSNLYDGDVCEVFIEYGEKDHYYEVEVAPNGAVFLANIHNDGTSFKGTLIDDCFVKTSAQIHKNYYYVVMEIPKDKIKMDKIKFNAFRIDTDGGKTNAHLFALHPTLCGSFHKKEFLK